MGKVKIKIRKKILTPDNLHQHRNYPALLKKYERNKRFKRALKIFLYSIALTVFVLTLIFISMWKVLLDKNQEKFNTQRRYTYERPRNSGTTDTVSAVISSQFTTDSSFSITYSNRIPFREINYHFTLDSARSINGYSFVSQKDYTINGKQYRIFEYYFDKPDNDDEETFFLYSPDFGIVLIASEAWGITAAKLINSETEPNQDITLLMNEIDKNFGHRFE